MEYYYGRAGIFKNNQIGGYLEEDVLAYVDELNTKYVI